MKHLKYQKIYYIDNIIKKYNEKHDEKINNELLSLNTALYYTINSGKIISIFDESINMVKNNQKLLENKNKLDKHNKFIKQLGFDDNNELKKEDRIIHIITKKLLENKLNISIFDPNDFDNYSVFSGYIDINSLEEYINKDFNDLEKLSESNILDFKSFIIR